MENQEIERLRAGTKGTAEYIHFNNAGCSLPPDVVVDTVFRYLAEEARCGGYETEAKYGRELEQVYALIARLIHAGSDEVAIVENASMAWHLAFQGIDWQEGDEVITSEMEYVTNHLGFLDTRRRQGIRVSTVGNDGRGNFDLAALEAAISPRTRLIAVTHIPSTAGNILPVEKIGEIVRRKNNVPVGEIGDVMRRDNNVPVGEIGRIVRRNEILYLVDACQSAGQLPLDVEAIGCDMLAVTGRKYLRAPRGTGFLYVRKAVQDRLNPLLFDGHSIVSVGEQEFRFRDDARRFELYEQNRGLALGLGAAIDYALTLGPDRIAGRVQKLAGLLREKLAGIAGVTVHDRGDRLCGIVTFSIDGHDATAVKNLLAEKKINVSVGNAVSTLLYMNRNGLRSVVRASVHYYNTEAEIERFCEVISGRG